MKDIVFLFFFVLFVLFGAVSSLSSCGALNEDLWVRHL